MKKYLLSLVFVFLCFQGFSQGLPGRRTMQNNNLKANTEVPEISAKDKTSIKKLGFDILDPTQKIVVDAELGAIAFISNPKFGMSNKNSRLNAKEQSYEFLNSVKDQLKFKNVKNEFNVVSETTEPSGYRRVKMQQVYKNVPIYGAEIGLHSNKDGSIEFMMGKAFPTPTINTQPKITKSQAIELGYQNLKKISIVQKNGLAGQLLSNNPDGGELMIYKVANEEHLIYYLTLRPNLLERWVYFIDAHSGNVLESFNHTCTLDGTIKASSRDLNNVERAFSAYQMGTNYMMIDVSKKMYNPSVSKLPNSPQGAIMTIDARNGRVSNEDMDLFHVVTNNPGNWNSTAVSAHNNASISYDYYETRHNRTSLNGKGGNIISVINISDEDGKGFDNAFWNGVFMGYGNGGEAFKPLAGALDVAGHEMTHGVIENTAKLEYRNQSGALNESFADIFGTLIDRDDWTLGEDVVKKSIFPSGALRSLQNPNQGGKNDPGYQPKNMSQYQYLKDTPEQDNGGVHINSGIPNHAFYLFATATGMNKDKAEKVYYRVLTNYLGRNSNFQDLRLAVIQSAKDLYGNVEVLAAQQAFDQVGIVENKSGDSGETTVKENPGTAKMVAFSTPSNDQRIYMADFSFSNSMDFQAITDKYGCLSKPSITDNGKTMVFVGNDSKIHVIDMDNFTHTFFEVNLGLKWFNVAISKDGKRLAAIADETKNNNFIYVFDLVGQKYVKFKLYNPTYSQGVNSGEVTYAEALEWDLAGENIIYDSRNKIGGWFSETRYFYDIGLLRAWNSAQKTFGDGTVEKVFANLPDGVSIGNPTFAKTNSNIIAFDYIDESDDTYYIFTADLSTSGNLEAFEVNTLGFPDFSKTDQHLIFNYSSSGKDVIMGLKLQPDKITADLKSAAIMVEGAAFGVIFAKGTRDLPQVLDQTITISSIADKRPGETFNISASASSGLALIYTLESGDASINGSLVKLGTTPGKVNLKAVQIGNYSYNPAAATVSFCIVPSTPTLIDNGNIITASGGSQYQFYLNGNPMGAKTSNGNLNKNIEGIYTVKTVTDDGCYSLVSNTISNTIILGKENPQKKVSIIPNPVSDVLSFKIPDDEKLVLATIFDGQGAKVQSFENFEVSVKNLSSGTYILQVKTDKDIYSTKIIKL